MLHSSPAPLVGPGYGTPWAPHATAFEARLAPRHAGTLSRRWRRGLWRGRADLPALPGLCAVRGIPCRRTARGAGGFHGGTAARGWVVADSVQLVDGGELSSAVRCGHACSHIEKIVRLTRLPGGRDALPRSAVILPTAASRRPHRRVLLHFQSLRLWAHAQTPLLDPRSGPPRPRLSRRTPHPPRRPAPPRSGGQARGTRIRARPCSWSCRRCCSWRPRGRPSAYYPSTCSLYIRRIVQLQVCLICILLILNRQSLLATHEQIIILLQIQGPSSDLLGSLLTHERPAWQGQQLCRKGSGSSSPNAIAPILHAVSFDAKGATASQQQHPCSSELHLTLHVFFVRGRSFVPLWCNAARPAYSCTAATPPPAGNKYFVHVWFTPCVSWFACATCASAMKDAGYVFDGLPLQHWPINHAKI